MQPCGPETKGSLPGHLTLKIRSSRTWRLRFPIYPMPFPLPLPFALPLTARPKLSRAPTKTKLSCTRTNTNKTAKPNQSGAASKIQDRNRATPGKTRNNAAKLNITKPNRAKPSQATPRTKQKPPLWNCRFMFSRCGKARLGLAWLVSLTRAQAKPNQVAPKKQNNTCRAMPSRKVEQHRGEKLNKRHPHAVHAPTATSGAPRQLPPEHAP